MLHEPYKPYWTTTWTYDIKKKSTICCLIHEGDMVEDSFTLAEYYDDPSESASDYLKNRLPKLKLDIDVESCKVGVFTDDGWEKFDISPSKSYDVSKESDNDEG